MSAVRFFLLFSLLLLATAVFAVAENETYVEQQIQKYSSTGFVIVSSMNASILPFEKINDKHYIVYAFEGQKIELHLLGMDPDKDVGPAGKLMWTYSSPYIGPEWQTKVGDKGVYESVVKLSDGQLDDFFRITTIVLQVNDPPVLDPIDDVTLQAGDEFKLKFNAYDPEGKRLTLNLNGWVALPTYVTSKADIGWHTMKATVSDGVYDVSRSFNIFVTERENPLRTVDYVVKKLGPEDMNTVDYLIKHKRYEADGNVTYVLTYPRQEDPGNVTYTIVHPRGESSVVVE